MNFFKRNKLKHIIFFSFVLIFISCETTQENNKNDCKDIVCKENSFCDTDLSCKCHEGYHKDDKDNCIEDVTDKCNPNPCKETHKTVCNLTQDNYECTCETNYVDNNGTCEKEEIEDFTFRVMASNLTTGMYQDYEEYGIRILQALKPDIVMIQEFNYDSNGNNTTSKEESDFFVKTTFGKEFYYYRGKEITVEDGDIPIPNGIISRYPIINSGEWIDDTVVNRNFNWVQLDIPGEKDLWIVSLHLKAGSSDSGTRSKEIKQLMIEINKLPQDSYIIIGGDLNTKDRKEKSITRLNSIFNTSGPYPVGNAGKDGTNLSRRNPYDWVIESNNLSKFQISSDFCSDDTKSDCLKYENGLVFDSKKYKEIDLSFYFEPVLRNDSRADNMQHMGVVKDFKITF